jgi:hypothetical protein
MVRKLGIVAAVFAAALGTSVALAIELEKRIETAISVTAPITTIEAAVDGGLLDKGWTIEKKEPGRTTASIRVREKHFAQVAVTYDTRSYAINLLRTEGLDQNDKRGTIHSAYGRWSRNLVAGINARLLRIAGPPASVYAPAEPPPPAPAPGQSAQPPASPTPAPN